MMKQVLFFLIDKKVKEIFLSDKRYKFFTYSLIIISVSFFIAFFLAGYYDLILQRQIMKPGNFLLLINSIFAISFLLVDFIPVFKVNPLLFPSYYPLKKYWKATVVLLFYSLKYYIAFVFLMYLNLTILSSRFGVKEFIISLLFVFCGYLVNRILKNITEYVVSNGKTILYSTITTIAGYVLYLYFFSASATLDTICLTTVYIILFVCFTNSETDKKVKTDYSSFKILPFDNFYVQLITGNNLSRTYLPAFLFKILWLLLTVLTLQSSDQPPFGNYKTMWMFATPLIVFLYTGINFFGYSKNLFFTHIIREYKIHNLAKAYIKSIGILLLVDTLVFWSFLIATGFYQWVNILFYYTVGILLLPTSFLFALYKPTFTNDILFFNLKSSKGGSIYYGGVAALIVLYFLIEWIRYTDHQLVMTILLLLIAVTGIIFHRFNFSSISHHGFYQMKKS